MLLTVCLVVDVLAGGLDLLANRFGRGAAGGAAESNGGVEVENGPDILVEQGR